MSNSTSDFATTIGADAVLKGELRVEKSMRLLGKFEGEITGAGEIVVADGAALQGDVTASTVRIEGKVKGNMHAKAKVQLTASARLEGDVEAARLEVAEGAVLVGRCVIGVNGQSGGTMTKSASAPAESIAPSKGKTGDRVPAGIRK